MAAPTSDVHAGDDLGDRATPLWGTQLGDAVGYLQKRYYDVVCRTPEEFDSLMQSPDAEEEAHSVEGRWVVRLRGEYALASLHGHLSQRV